MFSPQKLAQHYQQACMEELQAIKPGNVHLFADGHGMHVMDFIKSAEASAQPIAEAHSSVGERIFHAVKATYASVGMNTNLGIVLLCAPLIHAAIHYACEPNKTKSTSPNALKLALHHTLNSLTIQDAQLTAQAIVLANPAGLNSASRHDVHQIPQVTLSEMMAYAQNTDRIAWQYAHQFSDIFDFGLAHYQQAITQWQNEAWATAWVYINFLCHHLDTHVIRKYGESLAITLQNEALEMQSKILASAHPKLIKKELLSWDASLKLRKINPGTSADLTVATLLAVKLM